MFRAVDIDSIQKDHNYVKRLQLSVENLNSKLSRLKEQFSKLKSENAGLKASNDNHIFINEKLDKALKKLMQKRATTAVSAVESQPASEQQSKGSLLAGETGAGGDQLLPQQRLDTSVKVTLETPRVTKQLSIEELRPFKIDLKDQSSFEFDIEVSEIKQMERNEERLPT